MGYSEPAVMGDGRGLGVVGHPAIEAYPSIVIVDRPEATRRYWGAQAFTMLHNIYVAEGFLRDALAVCEMELEFGADPRRTAALRARLDVISWRERALSVR